MDPCQVLSTEDTESDIDRAMKSIIVILYNHSQHNYGCQEFRLDKKSKGIVHYDVKLICYPLKYSTHLLPIQAIPILTITANIIMTLFTTPSFFKKPTVLNIRSERPISLHGLL